MRYKISNLEKSKTSPRCIVTTTCNDKIDMFISGNSARIALYKAVKTVKRLNALLDQYNRKTEDTYIFYKRIKGLNNE